MLIKQLEGDILRLLAFVDIADIDTKQQHAIAQLKNALIDGRLEIQDYELAETRDNQLRNAKNAKQYLENVRDLIMSNPANVFGAVDVAHLTAQLEQISDNLR